MNIRNHVVFYFISGGFNVKKSKKIILAIACVVIVAVLVFAKVSGGSLSTVKCTDCDGTGIVEQIECETCGGEGEVRASYWALVPPVIAIALALITKEVYSSLFVGILAGSILGSDFKFTKTMDILVNDGLIGAVSGTAGIFIFLVVLGVIVALINKAGGSAAFGKWAQKHIKTRSGAMIATFALGVLIFIDDYFNCLTVGSVMRTVTDGHNVSRAKLSYLIDTPGPALPPPARLPRTAGPESPPGWPCGRPEAAAPPPPADSGFCPAAAPSPAEAAHAPEWTRPAGPILFHQRFAAPDAAMVQSAPPEEDTPFRPFLGVPTWGFPPFSGVSHFFSLCALFSARDPFYEGKGCALSSNPPLAFPLFTAVSRFSPSRCIPGNFSCKTRPHFPIARQAFHRIFRCVHFSTKADLRFVQQASAAWPFQ